MLDSGAKKRAWHIARLVIDFGDNSKTGLSAAMNNNYEIGMSSGPQNIPYASTDAGFTFTSFLITQFSRQLHFGERSISYDMEFVEEVHWTVMAASKRPSAEFSWHHAVAGNEHISSDVRRY